MGLRTHKRNDDKRKKKIRLLLSSNFLTCTLSIG